MKVQSIHYYFKYLQFSTDLLKLKSQYLNLFHTFIFIQIFILKGQFLLNEII